MTLDAAFAADVDRIAGELMRLHADHLIWQTLNNGLLKAPWAGEPGELMFFITNSHFAAFGAGLRRQLDPDARSVSLAGLIGRVANGQIQFRRDKFVKLYTDLYPHDVDHWRECGEEDFTDLCRDPRSPLYPAARAQRHLDWLKRRADPLKRYVDKSIAHTDRTGAPPVTVRFHERLLWVMMRLVEHYDLLVDGAAPRLDGSILLSPGWERPLQIPWQFNPETHTGLSTAIISSERRLFTWEPDDP